MTRSSSFEPLRMESPAKEPRKNCAIRRSFPVVGEKKVFQDIVIFTTPKIALIFHCLRMPALWCGSDYIKWIYDRWGTYEVKSIITCISKVVIMIPHKCILNAIPCHPRGYKIFFYLAANIINVGECNKPKTKHRHCYYMQKLLLNGTFSSNFSRLIRHLNVHSNSLLKTTKNFSYKGILNRSKPTQNTVFR